MRLRELQLIRYGRFEDCTLPFEPQAPDLHLIVGPNEAGKSTTLDAIGDLLFQFDKRARYDFRYDRKALRVGAVIEDAEGSFEVRRRRGNSLTLVGPDDSPISEARLGTCLAGQTRESFRRLFSLDQDRLRAGGRAVLEASDEIGQAIFAAGSGLVQVAQVCKTLDEEAKAIWTNRSGSRAYSKAADAYRSARATFKDSAVKPVEWVKARQLLGEEDATLQQLREGRSELSQQTQAVQRKRRVLTSAARRSQMISQLAALGPTPELTEPAVAALEAALLAKERAEADIANGQKKASGLVDDLTAARPSDEALRLRSEIETLQSLRETITRTRAQQPILQAKLEQAELRLGDWARELGWTYEGLESLKQTLPGRPDLAEVNALIDRRGAIDEQLKAARDTLVDARLVSIRANEALGEGPALLDIRPLAGLAREVRDQGLLEARERSIKQLKELSDLLSDRMAALEPWRGDLVALQAIPLPADETINASLEAIATLRSEFERSRQTMTGASDLLDQARLQLRQRAAAHPAPSTEDLVGARSDRQTGWEPLKAQLAGGPKLEGLATAIMSFEQCVSHADRLADERFDAAEHAGALAELEREIERKQLIASQARTRFEAAEIALSSALAGFQDHVSSCGMSLSPEAFPAWRSLVAEVLATGRAYEIAQGDAEAAREAESGARRELAAALGMTGHEAEADDLRRLLRTADIRIDSATEAATRAAALRAAAEAADEATGRAEVRAKNAEEADAAWTTAWMPALGKAGLPPETTVAGTRMRLEIIETARTDVESTLDLTSRLAVSELEVADFDRRTVEAAATLGLSAEAGTLQELIKTVQEAVRRSDRMADLQARLNAAETEVGDGEVRLAFASAELSALDAFAPNNDPGELRELLSRARTAGLVRTDLLGIEQDIVASGEGRNLAALVAEVEGADPDELARADDELSARMDEANAAIEAQSAAHRAAEISFRGFADGPDAAIAAFELAQAKADLAEQAEAYIRKRAELLILRAGIERYRQEKQAPLLERASELFATLTLGAFSGLAVDLDSEKPAIVGVRAEGQSFTPTDGMSEGTTDQLYLALRIAAVEDMIDQGVQLPFLADDLFVNFDDERAAAGFRVLAELATKTQVLFFTHHGHLANVATVILQPDKVSVCQLVRDTTPSTARPGLVEAAF